MTCPCLSLIVPSQKDSSGITQTVEVPFGTLVKAEQGDRDAGGELRRMLEAGKTSSVLDAIHAAALSPPQWDGVLRQLASLTDCVAGGLTVERPATRQGTPLTYFGFDPDHVAKSFEHFLPMNPLFQIEARMQAGFVVANRDVVAPDVFRRSDFFNGWARPQGLCSPITVVIHRTETAYVPLTLVRPDGAGEVTTDGRALLSRLAPHLVHAMAVNVRLQRAGAGHDDFRNMLEALPCGAALVDEDKRIVFANARLSQLFDAAKEGPFRCLAGKIVVRDPAADRDFQAALTAALGQAGRSRGSHICLPYPTGDRQLTVRLSPLPATEMGWNALGDDGAGRARCMMLFSMPDIAKLAEEYGLTPAEARVLSALTNGKGLTAVARQLGISRSTAHSHLDKIFQKTGTNRQAELVGLVQAGVASWTDRTA